MLVGIQGSEKLPMPPSWRGTLKKEFKVKIVCTDTFRPGALLNFSSFNQNKSPFW
jgi:signal recognition particle GTPase